MSWIHRIFPAKGVVCGGIALLIGWQPSPFAPVVYAEDPAPRLTERLSELSLMDIKLARQARNVLHNDEQLASSTISVTVKNRIATIRGNVPSPEQKQRAEKLVRSINGIATVMNECLIASPLDNSANEVLAAMRRAQGQQEQSPKSQETPGSVLTGRGPSLPPPVPANILDAPALLPGSDPNERVVGKPVLPVPPTTVLFHPDLSSARNELEAAIERVRAAEPRYRGLTCELRNGVVRISGSAPREQDAWELADRVSKVRGVQQVIVGNVIGK